MPDDDGGTTDGQSGETDVGDLTATLAGVGPGQSSRRTQTRLEIANAQARRADDGGAAGPDETAPGAGDTGGDRSDLSMHDRYLAAYECGLIDRLPAPDGRSGDASRGSESTSREATNRETVADERTGGRGGARDSDRTDQPDTDVDILTGPARDGR